MKQFIMDVKRSVLAWMQAIFLSLLFSNLVWLPYAHAGPQGGEVTGGSGTINQSGNQTTITQDTQNMAIDWQSYNVNSDERVQYIQPNSQSISLNRILSNNGSQIHGRIDANGQVILVNPHGIFFGPGSVVNVGGIVASTLDISATDFMNGNYIFNEVLGKDGEVVNSGIINAAVGGNVALLGKKVKNTGLIAAKLGSVTLAAGKAAVLSFDNAGLLSVKITKAILQDEIGVDPAVLNSGEILAEGGRVLLTASVSQDVFSQAVNTEGLDVATSVVVHEDGTFTLGGGADVVNTGTIDVSKAAVADEEAAGSNEMNTARIVLLGENVTSSGTIKADNVNGNGGDIELHANDTALLTDNSLTSARSESNGKGGTVKVLGNKVGLFDQAVVDVSGAKGGGIALIGGGREGQNARVRNAEFIYLGKETQVKADALDEGDGGSIIAFATDTARVYGGLFARGGVAGGNGGFIETSGLRGFEINSVPDVSAPAGQGGEWLIDPYNIIITDADNNIDEIPTGTFTPSNTPATLNVNRIIAALANGDVTVSTNNDAGRETGNIDVITSLDYNDIGTGRTLTLNADGSISFFADKSISDSDNLSGDDLSINLTAGTGITLNSNAVIDTQGGSFTSNSSSFNNSGSINTSGRTNTDGGSITITATTGDITTGTLIANGGWASKGNAGKNGGAINITSSNGSITVNNNIESNGSDGNKATGSGAANQNGGDAGKIDLLAGADLTLNQDIHITAQGGARDGGSNGADNNITLQGNDNNNIFTINTGVVLFGAAININGLGGNDTFNLASSILGTVDGGAGADIFNINDGGMAITTLDGGADSDTLNGFDVDNDWSITNANAGSLLNTDTVAFANVENLLGGTAKDDFVLSGNGSINSLDGGLGVNSLRARNVANIWEINAANGGRVTHVNSFSNIQDLIGGSNTDNVTLSGLGSINSIDGGGGTNTLQARDVVNTWQINAANGGRVTHVNSFSNIQNLIGGSNTDNVTLSDLGSVNSIDGGAGSNTLTGRDTATSWLITSTNAGSSDEVNRFDNIQHLIGGSNRDDFTLSGSGSIDSIHGGANTNTLTGRNAVTRWTITSANTGSSDDVTSFSYIQSLTGGSEADDFTLSDSGTIASINGGGGNNHLMGHNAATSWSITSLNTGSNSHVTSFNNIQNLVGGSFADDFTLSSSGVIGSIDGGGGGDNKISGRNNTTNWLITALDAGSSPVHILLLSVRFNL